MSRRRELDDRLHALRDINGILRAMKNLALMEQQKLTRFLTTQRRVVDSIEAAAEDFFTFYPVAARRLGKGTPVWLIIGSERGFCGDYNERLLEGVERHLRERSPHQPRLLLIGRKLAAKFAQDRRVVASLAGPTVAEEVPAVLIGLMAKLRALQASQKSGVRLEFTIIHQSPASEGGGIRVHEPMKRACRPVRRGYPPLLNLDPFSFATDLIDHHLFSLLYEVFYSSLMAENLRRFQHMDQSIQRLEKDMAELALKRNGLRQEEITEEIEVIMLSAEALRRQ
ncbi:MAG: Sodium-transporting ATPase subunit G [Nitrospira sp.]|jgi:F-type H+-transporting ATPase subunit gamma|nr:Sodium-transporting ATPase subunit G [Nitrospira sp.]